MVVEFFYFLLEIRKQWKISCGQWSRCGIESGCVPPKFYLTLFFKKERSNNDTGLKKELVSS